MGRINVARVLLGGLLAGLIINAGEFVASLIFAESMELALRELNLQPPGSGAIAVFFVIGFVMGIAGVWLYASMRPRFGPGPKTAVLTGLAVWLLGYFIPLVGDALMGLFDPGLLVIPMIWGLVEVIVAVVAGAWVYQEA
jgi:hypothetical protein